MTRRPDGAVVKLARAVTTLARRASILLVILALLVFNILSFAVEPIAEAMLSLTRLMPLDAVVSTPSELSTLRTKLTDLDTENRRLSTLAETRAVRIDGLSQENRKLSAEKVEIEDRARRAEQLAADRAIRIRGLSAANDELSDRVGRLGSQLRTAEDHLATQMRRVDRVTARITRRAATNAARNVGAIPLESVPILGVATILGVTALELRDACRTASDMETLRERSGIQPAVPGIVSGACSYVVEQRKLPSEMTIQQCRDQAAKTRVRLGEAAGRKVDEQCDCLELPDGCPVPEPEEPPDQTPLP
ncbi:hypothetical protein SAMN04490244_101182 [Tranquillimonas rosea]|uniref:Uncharacterized protein n=1 Tax=Tranquillimonas rosea TaxID=641238 RepID=A0A1H9PH55_9RHOB|nr:hypothetical protein [Tranquillimonas rosea]SER47551.1 hypothetical protein SAMN04490244_101182 [Tranquillimonas rosea]